MIVKTFKAPTLKEAMANVKSELGVDAVILHTTKNRKGGLLGFGGKEIVEVTAAIEDEQALPRTATTQSAAKPAGKADSGLDSSNARSGKKPARPEAEKAGASFVPKTAVNQYQIAGTRQSVADAQLKADKYDGGPTTSFSDILSALDRIKKADEETVRNALGDSGLELPSPELQEKKEPVRVIKPIPKDNNLDAIPDFQELNTSRLASVTDASAAQGDLAGSVYLEGLESDRKPKKAKKAGKKKHVDAELSEDTEDDTTIESLQNELQEMKKLLANVGNGVEMPAKCNLQKALLQCDVDESVVKEMVVRLSGSEIMADKDSIKARQAMEKYLRKTVRVASGITLYSDRPKIVALIGPTGVGKTTTLAKIAARFVLEEGVSAALITADTYRISAVEQLKTYSDILGLPLEIVYSAEALQQAIAKHADKKLILIDTAGRSQFNEYQMKELCDLLAANKAIEKHLVMSSTTKNRDAEEILSRFSPCVPDRIIFTKTDETSSLGLIMNILHKKKVALSYVTNGQSVPDDITPASYEKLAELLLR